MREAGPFDKVSFKPVNVEVGSDSGDGTVPLWSALLPSAKIYYVEDVHRYLPARGYIIDATIDLIASGRCRLPDTFPRRRAAPAPAPELPPVTDEAERLRGAIQGGEVKAEDLAQFYFSI